MSKLHIGFGQINPTVGDFDGNTRKICASIQRAETEGLDLVIFPELSVSGYPVWDLANKKSFVDRNLKCFDEIVRFTRGKQVAAALGFIDRGKRAGLKSYNAMAVLKNGRVISKQYKRLLPTYDVFLEEIFFTPGKQYDLFSLKGIPVGLTICEDIWDDAYPVKPARLLARKGAKVIINISASPYHRDVVSIRNALVSRKAKEYGVWILYANQVGGQDDLIFDGRSFVADPGGHIRFEADPFREALYRVSIDLGSKPFSRPKPKTTRSNPISEIYEALVLGLGDYVRKNRFQKVAVGLSGGIDSALVAALAADALGPKAVIGMGLPGPYSAPRSLHDAKLLAKNLGIEFRTHSIRSRYLDFIKEVKAEKRKRGLSPAEHQKITVAMENLQARLRGIQLMYLSNDEGVLLLTTGNKSELAMGYCTLYGDMCGGLSVIGDVYKTDVYRLAHYRNSLSPVIPSSILKRAPSAELRPHQKDQDSLPPYAVLDEILKCYIEGNEGRDEIAAKLKARHISGETVRRVISTVDHNEYKRRQLPPALRITQKAWFGRRMPITNHFQG